MQRRDLRPSAAFSKSAVSGLPGGRGDGQPSPLWLILPNPHHAKVFHHDDDLGARVMQLCGGACWGASGWRIMI